MASTAPVIMASSCWSTFPAIGMPCRESISFAVQQMPAMLIPLAPFSSAFLIISSLWLASRIISDRMGSWPCTMMLTCSSESTPRFILAFKGVGVPNRISWSSVPTMEPPQPSASAHREPCRRIFFHFLVDADRGAVHRFHDLAVDTAWEYSQLAPDLLAGLGRPPGELQLAFLVAEHSQAGLAHLERDLLDRAVFDLYPQVRGDLQQLYAVLDLVPLSLALGREYQGVCDRPAVVRVCRCPRCDHAHEVPRRHHLGGRAADASLLRIALLFGRGEAARSHAAVLATDSARPDGAGLHAVGPAEGGLAPLGSRLFQHLDRCFTRASFFELCQLHSTPCSA